MSQALNLIATTFQGYGPSETSFFPCVGVSGRAFSLSHYVGSECNSSQVKIISLKNSLKHVSFVCNSSSGGQRRNPDFQRQNRHIFSRNRNRYNEERDNSENLDESEFLSTKNGPILSLSKGPRSNATTSPGPKEREIVELFRKVQAQLRERAAAKEEKKFEPVKVQNKESETVDSLLNLLRKHSSEQGQRKVNGGNTLESNVDRPRRTVKPDGNKSRTFSRSSTPVKEEPKETPTPSVGRPVSSFRRRSPVPRVKYEPIVSPEETYDPPSQSELDVNSNGAHYEPVPDFESNVESDLDIVSGLELEQEEDREDELEEDQEIEMDSEIEFVSEAAVVDLSESILDSEEDVYDEKETEKLHTEIKDLGVMKLVELRAIAKARGMKGFSKLKKSELIGLLSDDSSMP